MRAQIFTLTTGLAVAVAAAAPVEPAQFGSPGLDAASTGLTANAGPRTPNPLDFPSVRPDETVNLSLRYWAPPASQSTDVFNSGGETTVTINGGETSLGTNPQGDEIVAEVTEGFAGDNRRVITVTYRTTNFAPLLRPNTQINGDPALLLSWHIGTIDAVEFGGWITEVDLLGANQGALFRGFFDTPINPDPSPDFVDHTGAFQAPGPDGQSVFSLEDGLSDFGIPLIDSNAAGYNRFSVSYTFDVVPAPASVLALAGGTLLMRRRRG